MTRSAMPSATATGSATWSRWLTWMPAGAQRGHGGHRARASARAGTQPRGDLAVGARRARDMQYRDGPRLAPGACCHRARVLGNWLPVVLSPQRAHGAPAAWHRPMTVRMSLPPKELRRDDQELRASQGEESWQGELPGR